MLVIRTTCNKKEFFNVTLDHRVLYLHTSGFVILFSLADKMKWWQIAVLVIAALTVVPCIVIVIGVMILCFIKYQSPNSKPRSSSCQQHQTVPSSNQPQRTGPESEAPVEMEQNTVYPFTRPALK